MRALNKPNENRQARLPVFCIAPHKSLIVKVMGRTKNTMLEMDFVRAAIEGGRMRGVQHQREGMNEFYRRTKPVIRGHRITSIILDEVTNTNKNKNK